MRLGYFPNVTHAVPIVADAEGFYTKHLGTTALKVSTFNAGPAAMEATVAGVPLQLNGAGVRHNF